MCRDDLKGMGMAFQQLLLHFMICHSKKSHRPRTSSCHKNSEVELSSNTRKVAEVQVAGEEQVEAIRSRLKLPNATGEMWMWHKLLPLLFFLLLLQLLLLPVRRYGPRAVMEGQRVALGARGWIKWFRDGPLFLLLLQLLVLPLQVSMEG